jgi:hypothetical protein
MKGAALCVLAAAFCSIDADDATFLVLKKTAGGWRILQDASM